MQDLEIKCGNCFYAYGGSRIVDRAGNTPNGLAPGQVLCRRYPPHPTALPAQDANGRPGIAIQVLSPIVAENWMCGEFTTGDEMADNDDDVETVEVRPS